MPVSSSSAPGLRFAHLRLLPLAPPVSPSQPLGPEERVGPQLLPQQVDAPLRPPEQGHAGRPDLAVQLEQQLVEDVAEPLPGPPRELAALEAVLGHPLQLPLQVRDALGLPAYGGDVVGGCWEAPRRGVGWGRIRTGGGFRVLRTRLANGVETLSQVSEVRSEGVPGEMIAASL
ncbi:hypothetical protein DL771_004982 [Monosporascus sp. 5C6A]|nr:hypothetical protein DL771_004982 [Monosporascus sp. 5C6A]